MPSVLRYVIIALVIVTAVAVLSVCGASGCEICAHVSGARADRSEPLRRIVRAILGALDMGVAAALSIRTALHRGPAAPGAVPPASFVLTPCSVLRT